MMKQFIAAALIALTMASTAATAQGNLTREQILGMTTDQLSELPLEDLMAAVETLGVASVDELFALIMNKNVSSASKEEESSFTSPLSSTVITKDEMRTYGVSTLEEALRLIPGMIVTEKTNGVYDIQMRGLGNIPNNNMLLYSENANTLVMIDGRPVHDYSFGAVMFDMLPVDIEDVDRIEVVRGAASALYGANAVQGVINIITEKPDAPRAVVSGSFQTGNNATSVASVALRQSFGSKWAAGLTSSVQYRERPTSDLYVIPSGSIYLLNGDLATGTELTQSQIDAYVQDGTLTKFPGGYLQSERLGDLRHLFRQTSAATGDQVFKVYRCLEPQTPSDRMFPQPGLARKNLNLNAYVSFKPADDIRFDLTGGYQQSFVNTTPIGDEYFSFNGRQSKTGYVALQASVKGLSLLANYSGGPRDYSYGTPGMKVFTNTFNASAEYDIDLGPLSLRPGVALQRAYYEDYVPDYTDPEAGYDWKYYGHDGYDGKTSALSGFLNSDAEMTVVAPSLRADLRLGALRLIGAFRSDKTNIPDKWNHSWQFAASYKLNERNFIRFVYGRANRSATMLNTNATYNWTRTELLPPAELAFLNNKEADLMNIDNFELGYRWQPSNRILLDAEAFISKSRDYGALMASTAYISIPSDVVSDVINNPEGPSSAQILSQLVSHATVKYGNLPYEARQFGVSLNLDWIISAKVVAKLNLNYQKTLIDNYYPYNQETSVKNVIQISSGKLINAFRSATAQVAVYRQQYEQGLISQAEYKRLVYQTVMFSDNGSSIGSYNQATGNFDMAPMDASLNALPSVDGFESKAAPNFYGMAGVIYKPIPQVSVSAFANYIGKRSFITKYDSNYVDVTKEQAASITSYSEDGTDLAQRLTLNLKAGYSPSESVEIFLNAHNLFNNRKREFVYSDEIGGLYTVGINFHL